MSKKLIYGPVPSRRLGLSLGVDLVPYKICSYNCIYCQIGVTPATTMKRMPYIPANEILSQVTKKLSSKISLNYITLGGSGEPTLNSDIGIIIDGIKSETDIPVALLTNGSLLSDADVRSAIRNADIVLPSFDAYDSNSFGKINRPHAEISFEKMAEGLISFRKEYTGQIWLEIFLVEGVNDTPKDMQGYAEWMNRIHPDKVHLNTAIRPPAEKFVKPVSQEKLKSLCEMLGPNAEIIASFEHEHRHHQNENIDEEILSLLSRRPCTLNDLASGLGIEPSELIKHIDRLSDLKVIEQVNKGSEVYYQHKIITL